MSNHHATMIRVATAKLLKATLDYARTDDRRHFDDMVEWQNRLWEIAKQVAAYEKTATAE
jgi:hypothetical protein